MPAVCIFVVADEDMRYGFGARSRDAITSILYTLIYARCRRIRSADPKKPSEASGKNGSASWRTPFSSREYGQQPRMDSTAFLAFNRSSVPEMVPETETEPLPYRYSDFPKFRGLRARRIRERGEAAARLRRKRKMAFVSCRRSSVTIFTSDVPACTVELTGRM